MTLLRFRTRQELSMTSEEKWELVRAHYESAYHVKFNTKPADTIVDDLYSKMKKLQVSQEVNLRKEKITQFLERGKSEDSFS